MNDSLLIDLVRDIAERLRSDEVLRTVTVITERTGDVLAEIEKATGLVASSGAGVTGLCIIVLQPTAEPETLEAPGPLLTLSISVRILEQPTLNSSELDALTVARRVVRVLHHYDPRGITSLLLAGKPAITGVVDPLAPLAYETQFTAREAVVTYGAMTSLPVISLSQAAAPASLTVTCATPGCSIFYTLDGSYPRPGGESSGLYEGPVNLTSACRVRAVAYTPGLIASSAAFADLT